MASLVPGELGCCSRARHRLDLQRLLSRWVAEVRGFIAACRAGEHWLGCSAAAVLGDAPKGGNSALIRISQQERQGRSSCWALRAAHAPQQGSEEPQSSFRVGLGVLCQLRISLSYTSWCKELGTLVPCAVEVEKSSGGELVADFAVGANVRLWL